MRVAACGAQSEREDGIMLFNDRRRARSDAKSTARALKKAQGPSLAPKGYKPDTAGRSVVKEEANPVSDRNIGTVSRKKIYNSAALRVDREGLANPHDMWNMTKPTVRK